MMIDMNTNTLSSIEVRYFISKFDGEYKSFLPNFNEQQIIDEHLYWKERGFDKWVRIAGTEKFFFYKTN